MIEALGTTLTHGGVANGAFWLALLGVGVALRLLRSRRPRLLDRTRWLTLAGALLLLLVSLWMLTLSATVALSVAWGFVLVTLSAAGAGALVALGIFSLVEFIAPKRRRPAA